MKQFILICFVALFSVTAAAQTLTVDQFTVELNKLTDGTTPFFYTKSENGLKQAYEYYGQMTHLYERLSKKDQNTCVHKARMADAYYNYACYAARLGKQKEAESAIFRAAELGFRDAAHAAEDEDLVTLHGSKAMKKALAIMKKHSYLNVLKSATPYVPQRNVTLHFSYDFDCPEYARTREYFKLDSVAGQGDDVSRIKNLMYYVHDLVRHDGNSSMPESRDAIFLYETCKREGRGINCRLMAIMLNEMCLSLGIPSRYVTCMPIDSTDTDCHVINAVYSHSLDKWIWIDPTFAAYVSDDNGTLLSIEEVRERLITDKPLVLNDDANWNHKSKQTAASYLYNYMAKNLYLLECPVEEKWGVESTFAPSYVLLTPSADTDCYRTRQNPSIVTTDAAAFWQRPKL